jgi:hypothetical protein
MDAKRDSSGRLPLPVFLFNLLVAMGEYIIPGDRLSLTGDYNGPASLLLALAGIAVLFLLTLWVAGRCLWMATCYVVSFQWFRYLPEH